LTGNSVATFSSLPQCRRRALLSLAAGLACLGVSWAASHFGWGWPDRLNGFFAGMGVGALFAAVLLWFMPDMSDAVPKRLARRYQREVVIAMSLYVGMMLFWRKLLGLFEPTWLRVIVALLPALMVCWVMRAFVRYVRDSDEMQRRIELESGSIAAMLVAAGYLGAGFLQSAKLIDVPAQLALIGMFPALCLFYGITKIFVARRYQ